MLDYAILRESPDKVKDALRHKGLDIDMGKLLELDETRRALIASVDKMRAQQREFNRKISALSTADKEQGLIDMKALSIELDAKAKELQEAEAAFGHLWLQVPNIPADDVPEGKSDAENKEIKTWGEKPNFDFKPKSHEELIQRLDLADIDRATKVAGSKFYYLKNEMVILEMAVLRMAMDLLVKKGFTPLTVPDLIRREMMYGAAHFPPEDDAYHLPKDDLYLAGTAEVGLAGYHSDEVLEGKDLPRRYAGFSACFRREAGSYGKKGSGLYRVHQFHKIEMFVYTTPEKSETEHQFLLGVAEELMRQLELPYRVVFNCGGDLGLPQYKKYDIEAWIPTMNNWGETHSCSNDTDYQARRLSIKYRTEDGKTAYVHTLNNTALASPRILIPLLEIHQQKDGSIKIPEALQKYTGFAKIPKSV
jgi:seryl-tRNA synthetase